MDHHKESIAPFELEEYFDRFEFSVPHLLSPSDCEALTKQELFALADDEAKKIDRELRFGYSEAQGNVQLREEIASLYSGLEAEHVLVAAPEECIYLTMRSLLSKGDHIVCTFPGYQSLYEVARAQGAAISFWQPEEERGWYFDVQQLKRLLRKNTTFLVVNFPHNPTGTLPDEEEYGEIFRIAQRRGIRVFSDEIYRFLEHDPRTRLPSAVELDDRAVALGGLSKAFSLPGARIGWIATKDLLALQRIKSYRYYTTICNTVEGELRALMALRAREQILSKNIERIRRNLQHLDGFFREFSHVVQWVRPRASSVCFPRLLLSTSSQEFCERSAKETGVMVLPSTVYQYGDRHFRIGYGRENFPEALEKFQEYLRNVS